MEKRLQLRVLLVFISFCGAGLFLCGCADTSDDDYLRRYDAHDDTKARAASDTRDDDVTSEKPGANPDQSNLN